MRKILAILTEKIEKKLINNNHVLRITKDAARHLEISEQVKKVKKVPPDIQLRFMQKSFFTQII